jgi:hypothetical protein
MEILVPLGFFAMIAAIVIVPRYLKSVERQKLQETLKASIEHGAPIPQEVVDAITYDRKPPASPQRDLRTGIIWLGVAVGFVALGSIISFEEPDALYPMLGVAAFPGFIGLAFIVIALFARGKGMD